MSIGEMIIANTRSRLESKLRDNKYLCLTSVLYDVRQYADFHCVGLLTYRRHLDHMVSRREVRMDEASNLTALSMTCACYDRLHEELQEILREDRSAFTIGRYVSKRIGNDDYDQEHLLVLRRVWPSRLWRDPNRMDEEFWIFAINPLFLCGAREMGEAPKYATEIISLVNAWFSWKREILERRTALLLDHSNGFDEIAQSFEGEIVRPIKPRLFADVQRLMRDRLKTGDAAVVTEARKAENVILRRFCGTICDPATECTLGSSTLGCHVSRQEEPLKIATGLNGFIYAYYLQDASETDLIKDCVADGFKVLPSAIGLLNKTQNEDGDIGGELDFRKGRERCLLRFLLAHVIQHAEQIQRLPVMTRRNYVFLYKLALLTDQQISSSPWRPEIIESLINVVGCYGHLKLGVPHRLDLSRHLRQTLRGETALHTLKQRYRDHFFHTIEVCLIGFAFLQSRPFPTNKAMRLMDYLSERCKALRKEAESESGNRLPWFVPDDSDDFLRQWWMAGIVHDTAYGIDVLGGTLELLNFFGNEQNMRQFGVDVRALIKKASRAMAQIAPELTDDVSIERGDHGVIAAAHLHESLKLLCIRPQEKFLPAVRAIAFHNSKHPVVDAGRDPVAALLILCDTIQNWGRSQLGFSRSPAVVLSRLVEAASTPAEEQFGPVQEFSFSMKPESSNDASPSIHVWETPGRLEIKLRYFDRILHGQALIYTCLDIVQNLQRVNFAPWGLDIVLDLQIPLPLASKEHRPVKAMLDQLERLVVNQEAAFLQAWIDELHETENEVAVTYFYLAEQNCEVIRFNLVQLGKRFKDGCPLAGGGFGDFLKVMEKWRSVAGAGGDGDPIHRPPV